MNILQDTTKLALWICKGYLKAGDEAIDCTCGRGNDTLHLAKTCSRVISFDIQEDAITSAEELLTENDIAWEEFSDANKAYEHKKVILVKDSHENMSFYLRRLNCTPKVIIFNLGYLPGGDKGIATVAESTLKTVRKAAETVKVGGLICITMYPGHGQGRKECEAVKDFARSLKKDEFHCICTDMLNQSADAPQILWITKKK